MQEISLQILRYREIYKPELLKNDRIKMNTNDNMNAKGRCSTVVLKVGLAEWMDIYGQSEVKNILE